MNLIKSPRVTKALGRAKNILIGESRRLLGLDPGTQPTARLALECWLRRLGPLPATGEKRILITALRSRTWIEWSAYAACVLRQKGYASTLLYRSSQISRLYREPRPFNFWSRVSAIPDIELVDLDSLPSPLPDDSYHSLALQQAPSCIAYDHHVEEADVRSNWAVYQNEIDSLVARTAKSGAALEAFIAGRSFHRFLCYSGLIAETGGLMEAARRRGLPAICLEGWAWRPGHMIYNLNAPALEYNVAGWMRAAGEWDESKEREIAAYLKFLDGERQDGEDWLDNFYRIQRDKLSAELPVRVRDFLSGTEPVFVAAPNVIGDSSTLRRETIFSGMQIWLAELIAWFQARPHLKLIVRAHPAEVWVKGKCVIHIGDFARRAAAGAPNVLVLDAADNVNTFSLLPFVRAGLAWLSSAAVDFVVRGIPTAVAAKPKYSGLGIVEEPASTEEYFALLERWAQAAPRPGPDQLLAGRRYLHMVFKGFSFEAGSRTYLADKLFLGAMPSQAEHDRFFRIILGEEAMPDHQ